MFINGKNNCNFPILNFPSVYIEGLSYQEVICRLYGKIIQMDNDIKQDFSPIFEKWLNENIENIALNAFYKEDEHKIMLFNKVMEVQGHFYDGLTESLIIKEREE